MENIDITLENPNVGDVNSVLSGPPGPAGFSPVATVSKTGNVATISITDENGTTTAQVTDGTDGSDGAPNTLTIGTVASGSTPSATITGDSPNQVLNLVLPKGDTGASGSDGVTPTIAVGSVTTVSPDTPANVTNGGTSTAVILNFEIPQGQPGVVSDCLSVPTIVEELPAVGEPTVFYFVPITYTPTSVTGSSVTLTVTAGHYGRISQLEIKGDIEQDTPPSNPEPLTGNITFSINGTDYTVSLGNEYLGKVTTHQDKIYNDGDVFYIHREVGYIASYAGEDLTGVDYICTSGTPTTGDVVYYALDTPTDTVITDTSLINQLRAIKNFEYPVGSNTIVTSANVTADLDIDYHEVDPHHQYKKYVYMIDTSNFEEIG